MKTRKYLKKTKKLTERKNKDENNDEKFIPYLDINVIPCNAEKYMAFYIGRHLAFLDSFQFMGTSLARLVDNLPTDKFIYTKEYFPDEKKFRLMTEKGVYPYDYMDSPEKFNETKLPKREDFS